LVGAGFIQYFNIPFGFKCQVGKLKSLDSLLR